jgi:hypothetical protein|tara:strand:+ start:4414 stop:4656 length:243 start_codon:yes stop_codon:yes gene_type:complete
MARYGTKRPIFAPEDIARELDGISKAALIDMAWNLAMIANGSDSPENDTATADRLYEEAVIVAGYRDDRLKWKRAVRERN